MAGPSSRAASPATVGEAELLRAVSAAGESGGKTAQDAPKKSKGKKSAKGDPPKAAAAQAGEDAEKPAPAPAKPPVAQQYVDHTYTNYAIVEEDDLRLLDENSSLLPNPSSSGEASAREKLKGMSCTYGPMKKNAGGVVQPFPGKRLDESLYGS